MSTLSATTIEYLCITEAESIAMAAIFAQHIVQPLVLAFQGEIGAGKTTWIRAFLRALGEKGAIKSPTFSLIESYALRNFTVHHFDLYRIHDEAELEFIGFRDYFTPNSICCIEWPERVATLVEKCDILFAWEIIADKRTVNLRSNSILGEKILGSIDIAVI